MNDVDAAQGGQRIVVGVDGSPGSRAALEWAIGEARARDAPLVVVMAWEYPYLWAEGFNDRWAEDEAYFANEAVKVATQAVHDVVGALPWPDWISVSARRGVPSQVLIEEAATASLLVVGTRGRGGFAGLLLGSVSTACVHHARCPVTVVPAPA